MYINRRIEEYKRELNEMYAYRLHNSPLNEGGAAGHLLHPFDDMDLTFGELKKFIKWGLSGSFETEVYEKLDGQNLQITWKDGRVLAARNKGHVKNGAKTALSIEGLEAKFTGRGEVKEAFVGAMAALSKAINALNNTVKSKMFKNGHKFINLEIIYPGTQNVIPYGSQFIIFHNIVEYDDDGEIVDISQESAANLAGLIKKINADVQDKYSIRPPNAVKIKAAKNVQKKKQQYLAELSQLQSQFGLKDSDKVLLYHHAWWKQFILDKGKTMSYTVPSVVMNGLIRRWAEFDKSYAIKDMKADIDNEQFLAWAINFDKNDFTEQFKKNIAPFEILFLRLAADVLRNVEGFLAINPNGSTSQLIKAVNDTVAELSATKDIRKIELLQKQLERLKSLGGMEAIVPSEGVVFMYNGKPYKLTGAFAPINQILGIIKYSR